MREVAARLADTLSRPACAALSRQLLVRCKIPPLLMASVAARCTAGDTYPADLGTKAAEDMVAQIEGDRNHERSLSSVLPSVGIF